MPTLMDFSDEVLANIAHQSLPDGIVAWSRCCKRLAKTSKDALMLHQTYKRKYSDIEIKMNEGAGPFLIEMLQDLRRTEYVRHVDFEYCIQNLHVPLHEDIAGILFQIVLQQPYVPLTIVPRWVHDAILGKQDPAIAILLLLLPNLETLFASATPYCEFVIRQALISAQIPTFRQPKLALATLKRVDIGDSQWDPANPGKFFVDHAINIFQGLPSLQNLMCNFRTSRALDNPCIAMQQFNGATALHIFDLELGEEDLDTILQHVSNVVEFSYIDRYFSNVMRNLDQILRKYAGGSLEDLVLKCVPTPNLTMPNHGFMTLKGFTALERVSIPLDTVRTLWNRSASRPTLIEFLPASVEDVVISGPTNTGLASLVLDELANAKEVHLPRIKSIHMSHIENASRTKVAGENAGIILELDESDDDDDDDGDDEKEGEEEEEEDEDNEEGGKDDEIIPMEETE